MKVLLLAAGEGRRLRPLTERCPKCLVPVAKRPLLAYWLDFFCVRHKLQVLVNTSYLAEQVRDFVGGLPDFYQQYITLVHEPKLLGTAGTLLVNKDFFAGETVLFVHADNLSCFALEQFVSAHAQRPKNCLLTMMTFTTNTPQSCGIVRLNGEGVVQEFYEKVSNPPGNLANAALYLLEPNILEYMANLNFLPFDFSVDILPHFLGKIFTFHNAVYHRDIGTPQSYKQAEEDFFSLRSAFLQNGFISTDI